MVAGLAGGFVVTWELSGQDGFEEGVYGQRYRSNGNPSVRNFGSTPTGKANKALRQ